MASLMSETLEVSVRGKRKNLPAFEACGVTILVRGRFLKTAEIFDEYWLERDLLPDPQSIVADLRQQPQRPDLLTFAQRVPDVDPMFQYHYEYDNYAVLPISTYEHWFQKQIPSPTRRNIRASKKRGITVRVCQFNQ